LYDGNGVPYGARSWINKDKFLLSTQNNKYPSCAHWSSDYFSVSNAFLSINDRIPITGMILAAE
jgi:hypothetical protein